MFIPKRLLVLAGFACLFVNQGAAQDLGISLTEDDLQAMPSHVFIDGTGLPDGSGDVATGTLLYAEHCAACHGSEGEGGKALELVGDRSLLATEFPDKGIAVFWPHAPTLYEYINRSMPPASPGMFSTDELYSLLAHLLFLNGLIEDTAVLDAKMLSAIKMPNQNGFDTIGR